MGDVRLNHLNLTVSDVQATTAFLETYFGLAAVAGMDGRDFALLRDDGDMALALMAPGPGRDVSYPPTFHIGFVQPTEAAVDELHARLIDDGYAAPAPKRFHGSWTFYFRSPGGFLVEVLC